MHQEQRTWPGAHRCAGAFPAACVAAVLAWAASGLHAQQPPRAPATRDAAAAQADPRAQVLAAERAFARTMAERDLAAFTAFVSEEALFFGDNEVLRGRQQVVAGWAGYFKGPVAPFSWEPDQVDVLASGTLALSTGPVRDAAGRLVARFNSVWRLEADGRWRVVFDKGSPLTAAERDAAASAPAPAGAQPARP